MEPICSASLPLISNTSLTKESTLSSFYVCVCVCELWHLIRSSKYYLWIYLVVWMLHAQGVLTSSKRFVHLKNKKSSKPVCYKNACIPVTKLNVLTNVRGPRLCMWGLCKHTVCVACSLKHPHCPSCPHRNDLGHIIDSYMCISVCVCSYIPASKLSYVYRLSNCYNSE